MVTCGALVEAGLIATWVFPLKPSGPSRWPISLSPDASLLSRGDWLAISGAAVVGLIALAFSWAALRRPAARWMPFCALVAWAAAGLFLWGWLSLTVALPLVLALASSVGSAFAREDESRTIEATKAATADDLSRREFFTSAGGLGPRSGSPAPPAAAPASYPPRRQKIERATDDIEITFED
jgi:hypothetical protein